MIYSFNRGGLGNQMFIYAQARALSIDCEDLLSIDDQSGFRNDFFQRKNKLNEFKTNYAHKRMYFLYAFLSICKKINSATLTRRLERNGFFVQKGDATFFDDSLLEKIKYVLKKKPVYLHGYWQNEKYFAHHKKRLVEELSPSVNYVYNNKILNKITFSNSVVIHVRKNHNKSINGKKKSSTKQLLSLNMDYYKKSIGIINARCKSPHFFCFGDDKSCFVEIFGNKKNYTVVDYNDKHKDSDIRDLSLMSLCNSFILSNSTFCWWAAWLSKKQSKTVICPNSNRYFGCGAIASDWIELQ